MKDRPDILEVVSRYTSLRKVGREYIGPCPLHDDRHPSLRINLEKQVWYCDPCGSGGDVIRFIELVENISFREAVSILGIDDEQSARARVTPRQRKAAELAATWLAEQRRKMNVLLVERLEQIDLADEIGDSELAEVLIREQSFLRDLYEDLDISRYAAGMLSIRPAIEGLTEGVS